jgi:hypothetical protein
MMEQQEGGGGGAMTGNHGKTKRKKASSCSHHEKGQATSNKQQATRGGRRTRRSGISDSQPPSKFYVVAEMKIMKIVIKMKLFRYINYNSIDIIYNQKERKLVCKTSSSLSAAACTTTVPLPPS